MLLGSREGKHWKTPAKVKGRGSGTVDRLDFAPTRVRFMRLRETPASGGEPPLLEELSAR